MSDASDVQTSESGEVRRIGRYDIVRKIATGGMAELFLARFEGPGGFEKRCAVKRILPQHAADETFRKMFVNEARVTAMFDHPNLVQIFELGEDKGSFFIAMELVNGMNLRQLLELARGRGQPIPPALAAFMMVQALDGLSYAHNFADPATKEPLSLVHRDISPQNILVSYEGAVKLVDFGIVKGASISGETQAGMLKGKVTYMSPEQASGEPLDGRSDLFSLGICFYEIVCGTRPFHGKTELMVLKNILEQSPLPVSHHVPTVPEEIEAAIQRALYKHPEQRFDDAQSFALALHDVLRKTAAPIRRGTLADYLKSLTEEAGTRTFDPKQLAIPRDGPPKTPVGFASNTPPTDESAFLPPDRVPTATPEPTSSALPYAGEPPQAMTFNDSGSGISGLSQLQRDAGVGGGNRLGLALLFILSAVAGAGLVWGALRHQSNVVVLAEPTGHVIDRPDHTAPPPPPQGPDGVPERAPPEVMPVAAQAADAGTEPGTEPAPHKPPDAGPPIKVAATEAPAKAPPPVVQRGTLVLSTTPSGLTVRSGRRRIGKTPLKVKLRAGRHRLRLSGRPGTYRTDVRVSAGQTTTETLSLKTGRIQVNTRPWSIVTFAGRSRGQTPTEFEAFAGKQTVKLVSEDGVSMTREVIVEAGKVAKLRARF